nr:LIM domain and actin-binding protein 1 isoform X3 [Drosophila takahashii]
MDQKDNQKDMDTLNSNILKEPSGNGLTSKKNKSKRSKTYEYDTQNINMKKSFTKFDDLQKRNLIHVRSRDSKKAQELFRSTTAEQLDNCRQCKKPVYKMEEVILQLKTGTTIFHKTCLRCKDCAKQLKPDSYNVHDGSLYCSMHFKLIFAPKIVYEEFTPRKPELIIRENQPIELPPDVARASDKPSLGLDELQQLDVRSKFKVFENGRKEQVNHLQDRQDTSITHSKSIRSTLNKLHKLGILNSELEKLDDVEYSDVEKLGTDDESDLDLLCSRKDIERERPVGLGEAMNDIRSKFEQGDVMTKEERREERKQEIQSIRSRLFLGKQAKIKEMYQLAVAESEQGVTSVGKTPDINVIKPTHLIKDRFESGDVFNDNKDQSKESTCGMQADADVFESGISKASRSIFMELDANISSSVSNSLPQIKRPDKKIVSCNQLCQEAQNAARAKQLRAKFEKWQINEIERELSEGRVDTHSSQLISNESIESAKTIRERFENMKNSAAQLENAPKTQIKRFV